MKLIFQSIIFFFLFIFTITTRENIVLNTNKSDIYLIINNDEKNFSNEYEININTNEEYKYIIFRTYTLNNDSSLIQIYLNENDYSSPSNYTYAGHLYHENIIALPKKRNKFFASVVCPRQCEGNFSIYLSDLIFLHPNDHLEFLDNEKYLIAIEKEKLVNNSLLQAVLLGPQIPLDTEQMKIGFINENKEFNETESIAKHDLLINNTELSYIIDSNNSHFSNGSYIGIQLTGNGKDYMRFMIRNINNSVYRIGDPAMYVLKSNPKYFQNSIEECFQIIGSKNDKYYQLRIITTTAIKFKVDNGSYDDLKYLGEHYKEYQQVINNICFKSNETTEDSNGNYVVPKKQAFYFQIIYNGNDSIYSIVEPLYEGRRYSDILYKGESRWYRNAKWSYTKTNVYIRSRNGTINAYQAVCTAFPYCYKKENLKNLTKLIYAFSAFISSMAPNEQYHQGSQNQVIHFVRCMEEGGCEIVIEYKSREGDIYLQENENHAKFLKENEIEKYVFNAKPSTRENKIILSLDIFSGDSVINFNSNSATIKRFFYGSSEKFTFENVKDDNPFISFNVIARTNSYYVVSYKELGPQKNEINIGESGLLLQALEISKKRTFNFWHNSAYKQFAQYIANFIPLNCKINVEYKSKNGENNHILTADSLGNYEDIMNSNSEKFLEYSPQYVVEAKEFLFTNISDNYCLFYVGASESSLELPTLLRENLPYIRTLSVNTTKAYLIWPFNYKKGNVTLKINFKNRIRINATIRVNNGTNTTFELSKSSLISINEQNLKKECEFIQGCEIALFIEANQKIIQLEKDYSYPIEVSISTGLKTPTHLQKGIFRRAGVNNNITDYYYFEVAKDEEGEITLDLKRGNGVLFGKIEKKETITEGKDIDKNYWRNKIDFPKENDTNNNLIYDPCTQKIIYNKKLTGKCDKDCFIIFGVSTKDNSKSFNEFFKSEYSIIPRYRLNGNNNFDKTAINIPINEFIIGSLLGKYGKDKYYDAYKFNVIEKLEGIEIEFKSGEADIMIGWGDKKPFNSKCIIYHDTKTQLIKLSPNQKCYDEDLPSSFDKLNFTFLVKTEEFEKGSFTPYYFRVRPIYSNLPHVIELNSDKETTCEVKDNKCYFLMPLYSYDQISKLVVYATTDDFNDVVFYYRTLDSKLYDQCNTSLSCKDYLADSRHNSTKAQQNTKLIVIPPSNLNYEKYVLITAESFSNDKISIVSSFKTYVDSITPTHNFPQILLVGNEINPIKINLDEHVLNITVIHVNGTGKISFNDTDYYPNPKHGLTIDTKGKNNSLKVENIDTNNDFIVLLKYKYYKGITDTNPRFIIDDAYGNHFNISSDKFQEFNFNVSVKSNKKYSIIRTYSYEGNSGDMHILYAKNYYPSKNKYEKANNLYKENIMVIPTNITKDYKITVICQSCNGKVTYYTSDRIHMDGNEHFEYEDGNEEYLLAFGTSNFKRNEYLQISLIGPQIRLNDNNMQIGHFENGKFNIDSEWKIQQNLLFNNSGLSALINPDFYKEKQFQYIYVKLISNNKEKPFLRFQAKRTGGIYYVGDPAVYILRKKEQFYDINQQDCITIHGMKLNNFYQFRLYSSELVNIKFNSLNKSVNLYYNFVFQSNEEKTDFCFSAPQEKTQLSFYFQVIKSGNNSIQTIVEPLYHGIKYFDELIEGETRFYRHAKYSKEKTNVIIRPKEGNIIAFQAKCTNFPYCWNLIDMENVQKLIYAFTAFVSSIDSNETQKFNTPEQDINLVTCKSKNKCKFYVQYLDQADMIELKENQNHAKFINQFDNDNYVIKLNNLLNDNKIEINLDIYSGDASIEFEEKNKFNKEKYEYVFYGTSEKYILKPGVISKSEIKFKIKPNMNTYYVISYRYINSSNSIGESGLLFQAIEYKITQPQLFEFIHIQADNKRTPYIVNIIPINCEIDVKLNNENKNKREIKPNKLGHFEDIILYEDENYNITNLKYEVMMKNFKGKKPKNNLCYFYVGASESSIEFPTLLRENTPYTRTLSKNMSTAIFSWPFPSIDGDVSIKINLENEKRIKAVATFNNEDINNVNESNSVSLEFSKSTMIELPETILNKNKGKNFPIFLKISLIDNPNILNSKIPVEVSLSTVRRTPQLIEKGVFRRVGSNDNAINYFFFEVQEGEEGEIILDFKRGNGNMFAKMINISDNLIIEKEWRNKIKLPKENDFDKDLIYNGITQNIRYKIKKCDQSCFIVFGVKTADDMKKHQNLFSSEYNLMVRIIDNQIENLNYNAVNIPMNEFIIGSLYNSTSKKFNDSYILNIPDVLVGFEIEFKSLNATIYISKGNNFDINSKCKIQPSEKIQIKEISKKNNCSFDIDDEISEKDIFRFIISIENIDNNSTDILYYFRIRPIYKNRPHIIDINADKETMCKLNKKVCNLLVPLYSYDEISHIVLYAEADSSIKFKRKVIESSDFDKCDTYDCFTNLLPGENEKEIIQKYITTEGINFHKNKYFMVSIISDLSNDMEIPIASAMKTYISSTEPTINSIQIIYITKDNKRIIRLNKNIAEVKVIHLQGIGMINLNNKNQEINKTITLETESLDTELTINNHNDSDLILALKYTPSYIGQLPFLSITDLQKNKTIISSSNGVMFQYKMKKKSESKYIILKTKTTEKTNGPIYIYMDEKDYPIPDKYHKGANLYFDNLLVLTNINITSEFFVTIYCPKKCDGHFIFYTKENIDIEPNGHFEFFDKNSTEYKININITSIKKPIQLILLGPQIKLEKNCMEVEVKYKNGTSPLDVQQGLLINEKDLSLVFTPSKYENATSLNIKIKAPKERFMRFMSRVIGNSKYRVGDPAVYFMKNEEKFMYEEDCIQFHGEKKDQNYQLRLISTYGIQMKINNGSWDSNGTNKYLFSYNEPFQVKEDNQNVTICFKSTNETIRDDGSGNKTYKQAFFFQVVHIDNNTIESNLEPLYEGWLYSDKLEYNQSRIYRHAKWSDKKTNVYIRSRGGVFNAYQGECTTFPNCTHDINFKNKTKLIYAFSQFISSVNPIVEDQNGYSFKNVHIVECKDIKGCFIDIYYNDQSEPLFLKLYENYAKFIRKNEIETYNINGYKIKDNDANLEINLDVLSGDAVLIIDKDIINETIFFGSSEKYIIKPSKIEGKTINLKVEAKLDSYYVISYRIAGKKNNNVQIGESGLLLQYVSEDETSKIFTFWHNNPEINPNPYIINVMPLNCNLTVTTNTTKMREIKKNNFGVYEDILHQKKEKEDFKSHELNYNIKLNNFIGNSPKDKKCYFYIGASESSKELPTLLREDLPYTRTLSASVSSGSFVWPYSGNKNFTVIKINLFNSISVTPVLKVNNEIIKHGMESFSKSTIIKLLPSDFNNCELGCPISLTLSVDQKRVNNISVPVEVILSSGRTIPQILPKGVFRRCGFNDDSINYYYIPLVEKDEGEVILDFRRGVGLMFAKFYNNLNKASNEKNAWRGKIVLPTEGNNDLEYNHATQKIKYNSSLTQNCSSCFLIVGVTNKLKFEERESKFISEYNIMVKDYKNKGNFNDNAINIPINEFIVGSIEWKKEYNDSYTLDILDNYKGIEIEFKSTSAQLYFTNKNTDPTPDTCRIHPSPEINIYNISNPFCQYTIPKNMYGERLKIQVSVVKGEYEIDNNSSLYYFRVRPIFDLEKNIIEINSDKETVSIPNNKITYFMLPLNTWDEVSNIIIFEETNNVKEFYYKSINAKEYDKCDDSSCWSKYLTFDENEKYKEDKNNKGKNYLILSHSTLKKSDYLIIKISTINEGNIQIITSIKNFYKDILSKPNYPQLIYLYEKETKRVSLNKYVSEVNVTRIIGEGTVVCGVDNQTLNESKSIILKTKGHNKDLKITNSKNMTHLLVLLKYNYITTPVNVSKNDITEQIKNISIGDKKGTHFYYNFTIKHNKNYTIFKTKKLAAKTNLEFGPMHIFMNEKNIATEENYIKGNYLYHENLMVIEKDKNKTKLFITVYCPYQCEGILEYYGADFIDSDGNTHFEFMDGGNYIFKMDKTKIFKDGLNSVQITLLNPQMKSKKEFMKIGNDSNSINEIKNISQGLLIKEMELSHVIHKNDFNGNYIYIKVTGPKDKLMRFTSRIVNNSVYCVDDPAIYAIKSLNNDFLKKECINIIGFTDKNYNFRLITSESISLFINNEKINLPYLSDYSTIISIKEQNSTICFNANVMTEKNGVSMNTTKLALYFQIVSHEDKSNNTVIEPLYEGWEYEEYIKSGQGRIFKHAKTTLNMTNVYILVKNGYVKVLEGKCKKYPYCNHTSSFENMKKLMYGFSAFVSSIKDEEYSKPAYQNLHIIHCVSKIDCHVSVNYIDTNNRIELYPNQTHGKFIQHNVTDNYIFKPKKEKINYTLVELNFDIISGDANIIFNNNTPINHIFFGSSEKFYFELKKVINQSILFSVKPKSNSYYAVSFRYQNDNNKINPIGESGLVLQAIKPNQTTEFQFWHNNAERSNSDGNYIINFIPINCQLKVNNSNSILESNSFGYIEKIFTNKDQQYNEHLKKYTAQVNDFTHTKNKNKYCYFYVGGSESTGNIPTLISENIPYLRTFNANYYKGVFNLPFPYNEGNLNIKINMFNSYLMNYSISVNEKNEENGEFMNSILIEINQKQLVQCKTINGCPITIKLELIDKNPNADVPIEIIVSSDRKQPLILPKGILRRTGIKSNRTDYYYIEIEKDEEGEVILDFKRRNGFMFGTLIKKNNSEYEKNKNWRENIKLPSAKNAKFKYNPLTQKIEYKSEDTKICIDGCVLIIGVESKDNKEKDSLISFEYTIYARYIPTKIDNKENLSPFAVNIPINEYIIGTLSKNSSQGLVDSYIYQINDHVDHFEIEFKSKNSKLYYILGDKNFNFSLKDLNISIDSNNTYIKKALNKINKNKTLKLVVKSDNVGKYGDKYFFRVNPVYKRKNMDIRLIEISSDKPALCIPGENNYCYFYLPIRLYDKNNNNLLLFTDKNSTNVFNIKFSKLSQINITDNNANWPEVKDPLKKNSNYIIIDTKKREQSSDIILITLYVGDNNPTTLYSTFKSQTKSISPNPNSLHLVYLDKKENQQIDISDFKDYLDEINITKINGDGKIKYDNNETKINGTITIKKIKNNNLIIDSESNDSIFKILYVLNDNIKFNPVQPEQDKNKTSPGKKDENNNKNNQNKIPILLIVGLSIILVVLVVLITMYIIKTKKVNNDFENNAKQLSMTLSQADINNPQKEPLVNKKNELE